MEKLKKLQLEKTLVIRARSNYYLLIIIYTENTYKAFLLRRYMNQKLFLMGILILCVGFGSALSVDNIRINLVGPGQEGIINLEISNEGNSDVEDVSLNINFLQDIIPIGSSEGFVDEIKENEEEEFAFKFRVSSTLLPGTYTLPYELKYEEDGSNKIQRGDFGIVVFAQPEVEVTIDAQNQVIGKSGTINMRLVNKGLADARFVSVQVSGEGLLFISDKNAYIGTIDSDDFETTSFEVIYQNKRPVIKTRITYRDFDNIEQEIEIDNSFFAYTEKEAIEKRILTKNSLPLYIGILFIVIVCWIIFRKIRKKQKTYGS